MVADRSIFGSAWRTLRFSLGCTAACCAVLVSGCKADPARELLEQELRYQEDEIYHLENHLDDFQKQVEALRAENAALRNGDPVPVRSQSILSKVAPAPEQDRTPAKRGTSNEPSRNLIPPPKVDLGAPSTKLPDSTFNKPKPQMSAPVYKETNGPLELPDPTDARPTGRTAPRFEPGASAPTREEPTQLLLNPRLTGGWAARGHASDEGIRVLLQPVSAAGKSVRTPGALSVALIDPSLDGDAARVAKWEIPLEQSKELFRQASSEGVRLDLRWPGKPPANSQLQLFVRYRAPSGMELVADQMVTINTGSSDPVAQRNPYVIPDDANTDQPTPAPAPTTTQQRPGLLRRMGDESSRLIGRKPTWSPDR